MKAVFEFVARFVDKNGKKQVGDSLRKSVELDFVPEVGFPIEVVAQHELKVKKALLRLTAAGPCLIVCLEDLPAADRDEARKLGDLSFRSEGWS